MVLRTEVHSLVNLQLFTAKIMKSSDVLPDVSLILPPPFDWCRIPAGPVTLVVGGYVPEGGQTFAVQAFAMAKYPITNAQFDVFVEANDGYCNPKWWDYSDDAKAWRKQNTKPQDPALGGVGDHPRANVTWYEAVAFCRWLSVQIDPTPAASPNSGRGEKGGGLITLPTEPQWQRAAQALPDGRDSGYIYPWGNDWDGARCNNSMGKNRRQNRTAPVTQYEGEGRCPCGVADLSGNVWEWCLTKYETGGNEVNRVNDRVLRGGSWYDSDPDNFRADVRYGNYPDIGYMDVGFRFACSLK